MFLNRIDNLHNHDNSIILIVIFFIRIDTVQKLGNALITQFSDIIERIKSQPSAQRSTQNCNVGYTYLYSPNLNEIDDITINNYVQLCLKVVWERPPYFAGRGINVEDNKSYHI